MLRLNQPLGSKFDQKRTNLPAKVVAAFLTVTSVAVLAAIQYNRVHIVFIFR